MATPMQGLDMESPAPAPGATPDAAAPGAAPAAPPVPGLEDAPTAPRPQPVKPTVVGDNVLQNALSFFRDPDRLKLAAMAAAEAQRPDLLQWIKQGYEAQKENGIDALAALSVGNKAKALQLFNASGDMKATSIEEGPTKGVHTVVFADGTRRDVNALQELKQFLTPPQRFADERANELLDFKKEHDQQIADLARERATDRATYQDKLLDIKRTQVEQAGELGAAKIALAGAQAGLANARAGNVGAEKSPKPPKPSDIRAAVESAAERVLDPKTGKETFDREEALQLKTRVERIIKNDPSIGLNEAVTQAKQLQADAYEAAGKGVDAEIKDLKDKKSWYEFGDPVKKAKGMTEQEYRVAETKKRANAALAAPRGDDTGTVASPPPSVPKAPHPDGTKLRGKDGRNYTVVNGLPQLDAVQPKR
ncbi:MAG TPA: hypothetical protein PKV98_04685 [Burkholderiaceae bacterium]|nr:hypothetical protein [Burkholderiaceae bacterium]